MSALGLLDDFGFEAAAIVLGLETSKTAMAQAGPLLVLVRDGGELILLKGASAPNEIEAAQKQLRTFGIVDARVEIVGEDLLAEPTRVVRGTVRRGA